MKRYKVTWDNQYKGDMFPLSAEYSSITEAFDCLRTLAVNAKNVKFDEDVAFKMLAAMANGEASEYVGTGFIITGLEETP